MAEVAMHLKNMMGGRPTTAKKVEYQKSDRKEKDAHLMDQRKMLTYLASE